LIHDQGYLPIMQPFIDIGNATGTLGLVKPFVDLLSPATVNPVTLTVDLVVAVGQGIQAFVNDVGGTTLAPVSPFTTGPSTVSTLAAPNSDPPVNNSVVDPNPNPKPNPSANAGTQSLTINNSQMTPGNGQLTNPFTLPGLPKPNGSSATPPTGSNGWKPGAVIQGITTAVKDVINGLTHPFAPKSGAGSSGSQSTSGSQAAA
jgi:predicted component of type VI protein secretion system